MLELSARPDTAHALGALGVMAHNVIVNLTLVSFTVVLSEDINFIYLNENKS